MINQFEIFWKKSDKFTLLPALFSALIVLVLFVIFPLLYELLPNRLPLFYSLPWGDSQLVSKEQFFLLPLCLLLIILLNSSVTSQLHSSQKVLKRVLMGSLVVVDLIIVLTVVKIFIIFI